MNWMVIWFVMMSVVWLEAPTPSYNEFLPQHCTASCHNKIFNSKIHSLSQTIIDYLMFEFNKVDYDNIQLKNFSWWSDINLTLNMAKWKFGFIRAALEEVLWHPLHICEQNISKSLLLAVQVCVSDEWWVEESQAWDFALINSTLCFSQ